MSTASPEEIQFAKSAINEAMDILQRRWTLRLLWELKAAPLTFRALQAQCGEVSPSVLNQRLAELRDAGLVERGEGGYALTPMGVELTAAFSPLTAWAVRWKTSRPEPRA
ncbi:MAG: helix-turn-helix domain-containing protein [Rhizobacter sp.]|jgi:DNA-binding HxlR family transcriptional regulator